MKFTTLLACVLVFSAMFSLSLVAETAEEPARMMIFDFTTESGPGGWEVEDDVVMGGVSSGSFAMSEEGHAVFSGDVSLDNNGGFSSIQYYFDPRTITGFQTACLRIKGDGKPYQFIVEAQRGDRHYYSYRFETGTEWETVRIPLNEMEPYRRGDRMDRPNFPAETLSQVRFLIGNAKAESFHLEIDAIWLE